MGTPNVEHVQTVDPQTYPDATSAYVVWSDTAQSTAKPRTGGHIETLVSKREAKANGENSLMTVAHKWILPEGQLLCDKDEWEQYFPFFRPCSCYTLHIQCDRWYCHRLELETFPFGEFADTCSLSHITAQAYPAGGPSPLEFTFHFFGKEGLVATMVAKHGPYAPTYAPIITYWAMYELLLPTFFVLMQALQWPMNTLGTRVLHPLLAVPDLQHTANSAKLDLGRSYGLYTHPFWKQKLRVISQYLRRMDIAWVSEATTDNIEAGITTSVLEFYSEENFPGQGPNLYTVVVLLGVALSSMMGRDISCKADRRDQRVPTSPEWKKLAPDTPIA